ncbi:flavodoxin domain-containing protein [Anaerotignum sp.]|uniref:flavodoxin domain-containing protein n=1 Tax=Anaerotignum sp. TaxID=2039241 RepID=UPI00331DC404
MGKTAVVYRSEYGSTKKYATYIGKQLQAHLFSTDEIKDISDYDTIIYGGGIYGGSLNGNDWLKRNQEILCKKNLIIFTCGISNPSVEKNMETIYTGLKQCLTEELLRHAKVFSFRGALDFKKLKFTHKGMMTVMFQILKGKKERSVDEEELLKSRKEPIDFVDLSAVEPMITYVKE